MTVLVTGGLGFIGSHTVQALLDLGEECVLVQRRTAAPAFNGGTVTVEQADIRDLASLRAVGERHRITGIVHLAGSMPWPPSADEPVEDARRALGGLFNIMQVAQEWGVRRVGVASTIGVYVSSGLTEGALTEDMLLSLGAAHPIPTFKKIGELLGGYLGAATGVEVVNYRISGTWGPRGHSDPFFAAPALVHAAARGVAPDFSGLMAAPHAEDALDLCYVKDTGRAIALLQLADELRHATYNVASGRATSNAEVIAAIRDAVPDAAVDLPSAAVAAPRAWLDITRLRDDTGFTPEYDTTRAAADYIAWLRAGNEA
ncbi:MULTISPECIES: NAD-dependent epimerase/dehydratase family protein [Catenuloplanes]|uniref:UDP-glucose 4-epimerase n=1 Tax=Catenuloplanes niger TaxID=587534 RepID=A0AAE4CNW2_9ACTN|nr:NAD(P)-dependent oxidoreductase [Catenuloplanes niger]MDR7319931.1 UDP-glucose 4-epimerase [Catenuloplanes niger]